MSNLRFTLYLVLIFLVACRQESSLERALAASGDNRKELELVLDYFRGDSLKYKAACFLIENMPGAMIHCRIPTIMILCLYTTSIPGVKTGEGR